MIGEPDAGKPPVRFDEGMQETCVRAARLRPTLRSAAECILALRPRARMDTPKRTKTDSLVKTARSATLKLVLTIPSRLLLRWETVCLEKLPGLVELRSCRGCRFWRCPNSENASMGVCSKRSTASESVSQLRGATNGEWARLSWGRLPSAADCEHCRQIPSLCEPSA